MVDVPEKRATIDGVQYAVSKFEVSQLGRILRHDWDEGFDGGMGQHQWRPGDAKDRYYMANACYGDIDGIHLPPILTWDNTITQSVGTTQPIWVFTDQITGVQAGRQVAYGTALEVLNKTLFADVFGVAVDIAEHPDSGRPLVISR